MSVAVDLRYALVLEPCLVPVHTERFFKSIIPQEWEYALFVCSLRWQVTPAGDPPLRDNLERAGLEKIVHSIVDLIW